MKRASGCLSICSAPNTSMASRSITSPVLWVLVLRSRTRTQPAAAAVVPRSPRKHTEKVFNDRRWEQVLSPVPFSLMEFIQATTEGEIDAARELFKEYAAGLAIDICFQNFDHELKTLPGKYAPPDGRLLLAYEDDKLVGCIALRKLDDRTCEMKRLFLRPGFRGRGYGRGMIDKLIEVAREIGYQRMVLDTLPGKMDAAIALYRELGFEEIPAYYYNPL